LAIYDDDVDIAVVAATAENEDAGATAREAAASVSEELPRLRAGRKR